MKTTVRYYLTPFKITIMKKNPRTINGERMERRELSYIVGGNVN